MCVCVCVCVCVCREGRQRLRLRATFRRPTNRRCVAADHGEADALPQPCGLAMLSAALTNAPADVLQHVCEGWTQHPTRFYGEGHKFVALGVSCELPSLAFLSRAYGCSNGGGSIYDVSA